MKERTNKKNLIVNVEALGASLSAEQLRLIVGGSHTCPPMTGSPTHSAATYQGNQCNHDPDCAPLAFCES